MDSGFHKPPRWILTVLRWFCPQHLLEEIEGDLLQWYERDLCADKSDTLKRSRSVARANRKLLWNTLKFIRPGILLRNNPSINLTTLYMFSNYLKVALRFMFRN